MRPTDIFAKHQQKISLLTKYQFRNREQLRSLVMGEFDAFCLGIACCMMAYLFVATFIDPL
jgi:hypothetical protein